MNLRNMIKKVLPQKYIHNYFLRKEIKTKNKPQELILRRTLEVQWAQIYHDTIKKSSWLPEDGISVSPGGGAVGYQFLYLVYRILNENQIKNILELGLGQSTLLLGQYAMTKGKKIGMKHVVGEHDKGWIDICRKNYPLDNSVIVKLDIDTKEMPKDSGFYTYYYANFRENILPYKYNMIVVDAPYGYNSPVYSRMDILEIIPEYLDEDFCIIFDDYDRYGEKNTVELVKKKLSENGIKFFEKVYKGENDICMIVSESYRYFLFY